MFGYKRIDSFGRGLATVIETILTLCLISGCYFIAIHERQNIYDWIKLIDYKPPSAIVQLADQDTMTSYARKMFYVNHPQVDSKTSFASVCPNGAEQTVVLGCYHSNETGIYLLSVDNSQLSGIEQVTAAHETLHAIYEQLPNSERNKVDAMLESYYQNDLTDPVIKAQIASYKQSEPGAVINEMHSLFGTEVANLPSALEAYYSKYFVNRQSIVTSYENYESAFTSRQDQINSYDQQLTTLNSQINTDNSLLNSQSSTINSEQSVLEQEKSNGQIAEYNQGVPGYNQLVNQYNSLVESVQSLVSQYNQIVSSRNSIVLEEQQLVNAISSSKQTISNN